jgi:AcrR family transcriptional regulator
VAPAPVTRPVQARTIRNTDLILRTALDACAEEGWPALLTQRVATRSGLAGPTVRGRFPERSLLAAALWKEKLAVQTISALADAVESLRYVEKGVPLAPLTSVSRFTHPSNAMGAAGELMIASLFDSPLQQNVQGDLGEALRSWLVPAGDHLTPQDAARNCYVLSLTLGLLVCGRALPRETPSVTSEIERRWNALTSNRNVAGLPTVRDDLWDEPIRFDTGDFAWDAVLRATMEEVGRRGYDAATMTKIAEASHFTQGAIFSRYASKRELFLDATRRMVEINSLRNEAFHREMIEKYGPGIAEAVMLRGFMKPSRRGLQIINLEQFRLAWHDSEMQATIQNALDLNVEQFERQPSTVAGEAAAWVHCEYALGIGSVLLAALCPEASSLPLHVVTIPLLEGK